MRSGDLTNTTHTSFTQTEKQKNDMINELVDCRIKFTKETIEYTDAMLRTAMWSVFIDSDPNKLEKIIFNDVNVRFKLNIWFLGLSVFQQTDLF